jgi:hypothetical protein
VTSALESTLSVVLSIASGVTVAWLTYYLTVKHERAGQRSRIVGQLRWLVFFLEQIKQGNISMAEAEGKLPWWADHMLQAAADAFDSLNPHENERLSNLISQAWADGIWVFAVYGAPPQKHKIRLDLEKVGRIAEHVESLIATLSKKDP